MVAEYRVADKWGLTVQVLPRWDLARNVASWYSQQDPPKGPYRIQSREVTEWKDVED